MATNNFKPFGIGADANVTAQADYEALAALLSGFQSGKASSAQVNKAIRQGTVMASVLAQFIANASGNDVLDNGDTATIITNFIAALKANGANDFLQKTNNLSEIKSTGTTAQASARTNLGLGNSATLNTGTAAGTVATGNDSRITGAAQKGNNLSDLASAPSARTNLGLGNSATLNVGTVAGTIAAADDARIVGALQKSSNLADLPSASSSRANLGLGSAAVANIGTGGGMVPDMSSFTSGASGSASWQRLPSGMLLQYGYINTMSAGLSSVVYPVPFTTYLRSLTLTPTGNLGAASVNAVIPSLAPATGTALTVFSASGYNIPSSGAPVAANILFYWEAIGV